MAVHWETMSNLSYLVFSCHFVYLSGYSVVVGFFFFLLVISSNYSGLSTSTVSNAWIGQCSAAGRAVTRCLYYKHCRLHTGYSLLDNQPTNNRLLSPLFSRSSSSSLQMRQTKYRACGGAEEISE